MTTGPSEPYEEYNDSPGSQSAEWWVNTQQESLGLQAGSETQQRKMRALRETPRTKTVNGIPIQSSGGETHISYSQAMNWLWEKGGDG